MTSLGLHVPCLLAPTIYVQGAPRIPGPVSVPVTHPVLDSCVGTGLRLSHVLEHYLLALKGIN